MQFCLQGNLILAYLKENKQLKIISKFFFYGNS